MSLSPTPTIYFPNIDFNPLFYEQPTGISLTYANQNYLQRVGNNPTSVAFNTSFSGNLKVGNDINLTATNGLLSTNSIVANSASVYGNTDIYSYGQTNSLNLHDTTQLNVGGKIICTNTTNATTIEASAYFTGGITCNKTLIVGNSLNGNLDTDNRGQLILVSPVSSDTSSTTFVNNLGSLSIKNNGACYVDGNINGNQNIASKGNMYCYNTTESDGYTSGSIITKGGMGIGKNLNVNGNVFMNGNLSCDNFIATAGGFNGNINFYSFGGTHSVYLHDDTKLTIETGLFQTNGKILSTNTTNATVIDASMYLNGGITCNKSLVLGNLDYGNTLGNVGQLVCLSPIIANTTSTTFVDNLGSISIRNEGALYVDGNVNVKQNIASKGNIYCYNTTDSGSSTTGSIITQGGVGIGKNMNILGNIKVLSTTNGSESGNASISTAGGMYIAKILYMGNVNTRAASIVVQSTIQSDSYPLISLNYSTGGIAVKGGAGIITEGNVNAKQNMGILGNSYVYTDSYVFGESVINDGGVNNNFAVSGVISCDKIVLGNCLFSPSITCNSLKSYGEINYLNQIGAFINLTTFPFSLPVSSSILNITTCYTNLNLSILLSTNCSITLQPHYKINITNDSNYVMTTIDNTNGTSPLYANLPYPNYYSDYSNSYNIYLYYNNVLK